MWMLQSNPFCYWNIDTLLYKRLDMFLISWGFWLGAFFMWFADLVVGCGSLRNTVNYFALRVPTKKWQNSRPSFLINRVSIIRGINDRPFFAFCRIFYGRHFRPCTFVIARVACSAFLKTKRHTRESCRCLRLWAKSSASSESLANQIRFVAQTKIYLRPDWATWKRLSDRARNRISSSKFKLL